MPNPILILTALLSNIICVWSVLLMRREEHGTSRKYYFLLLSGIPAGAVFALLFHPLTLPDILLSALTGGAIGELLTVFFLTVRQTCPREAPLSCYDDGSPGRFFITGDKHRRFDRVKEFCREVNTRPKDVLIILGDTGFNYYDDKRDDELKKEISQLPVTLFCLHGNKENRPQNVGTYGIRDFCGGKVYYEPKYPNLLFAIDGCIYTFEGRKYMVVGGAHSVDKLRCLEEGTPFWQDEMPDDATKEKVEEGLKKEGNKIYGMLTHTCPIDYLPTETFLSTRQNATIRRKPRKAKSKKLFRPDIDRSTEIWLGEVEKKLDYEIWFCGHYHVDKPIDKICMMHRKIRPLHLPPSGEAS
mgnify:FL=1